MDGIHFNAPFPTKTALMLLRGQKLIPDNFAEPEKIEAASGVLTWLTTRHYSFRGFNSDGGIYLNMIKNARDAYKRNIKIAVLTGRRPELHMVTKRRVTQRYEDSFDYFFMNNTSSASGYKESVARKILDGGNSMVHIDDDLRVALRIARASEEYSDQQVVIYLKNNLSNGQWLLARAGVELPPNIIPVGSLRDAGVDFTRRVRLGKI